MSNSSAFADDVCVIGIAHTGEAAATLLNPVLAKVSAWMEQNGLKLAPTKTEADKEKQIRQPGASG